jgi:myo-inositol catabolism protein IolC
MGSGWVVFAYVVVYGFMIGYTVFSINRLRVLRRQLEDKQAAAEVAPAGAAITAPNLDALAAEE